MVALALLAVGTAVAAAPDAKVSPELLRARLAAAQEAYDLAEALYRQGRGEPEAVYRWSHRWLTAQQALAGTKAERTAAAEAHLGRMKRLEEAAKAMVRVGTGSPLDERAAKYYVAEAEVWLAQAKDE
jgi:outer membrane protein TolC